jgi:hypothetical protein
LTITCAPASAWVDPDRDAVELEERRLGAGLEVALLVEHAVVGQEHLAVDGPDLAVGQHGGRVVDVVGALGEADQRHDVADVRSQLVQRRAGGVAEVRLQQEVLGRVAGQGQLGEHDELRAGLPRTRGRVGDPGGVPVDVADDRVDLRQRDAQRLRPNRHRAQYAAGGAGRTRLHGAAQG